jgi:hypothetical protein
MIIFCTSSEQAVNLNSTKSGTTTGQALGPSINNTNSTNNKTVNKHNEQANTSKIDTDFVKKTKTGKNIPPSHNEVAEFFRAEKYPEVEAHKFFNYYQSNGWKVGGRSPMQDWHAAAINWMLNSIKFQSSTGTKINQASLNATTNKDYSEPL